MSFYIQHGYGKGQKIQSLVESGNIQGVILSPSDEESATMKQTVAVCNELRIRVLLDPQTYIYSATPPGSAKRHASHGLEFGRLHWSQEASSINRVVQAVEDAHIKLDIFDTLVAPTILQPSFSDVWTPLALQYARAASSLWGGPRTIVTIAIDEHALNSWNSINDWMDIITTLDVRGFYVLVQRDRSTYPAQPWAPERLANLMRLIYTLGAVNRYEVLWGYSDIEGLVGMSAGATGIASGWNYGSRVFSMNKWYPSMGGRAPAPRVGLGTLLTPVRAVGEADILFESEFRDRLFTAEQVDYFGAKSSFIGWSRSNAQQDHLVELSRRANILANIPEVSNRVKFLLGKMSEAEMLFAEVIKNGKVLDPVYARRIESMRSALEIFREAESL